jgi:uroporphyrinogen-III synthase
VTPLDGKRVVVTRAPHQAGALCSALEARGAASVKLATVAIRHDEATPELDAALAKLSAYDWVIFTSANTAESVLTRAGELNVSPDAWFAKTLSIAAIGDVTARALRERGVPVRAVASSASPDGIVDALGDTNMANVLLPQSDLARPELTKALQAHGATVHGVTAYRTLPQKPPADKLADALTAHAITFASPSAVTGFVQGLSAIGASMSVPCAVASIGPVTSAALKSAGMTVDIEAHEASVAGLVLALELYFAEHGTEAGASA